MDLTDFPRVHLVFPAAGIGQRFGQPHPKQYTQLAGKTLLEWTLDAWSDLPFQGERILVLSGNDAQGHALATRYPGLRCVEGGAERAESVLAGLSAINAATDDWVMVHDIARPCVRRADILALLAHCQSAGQGALLARPLTDTIKRKTGEQVSTVDRRQLWAAMTPQCFRHGQLHNALSFGLAEATYLTDEASAMEALGEPVGLVSGSGDNIKVTHPDDLALVAFYLEQQGRLSST
ncbi:2-C-methyl-D-erythritol 4-phosphate cytidylyltransferase [Saccharospirillum impatiens]|uniref:2-C-methyl-D-erythritol 4-phosphate cytidylyltransferase n=1 Tax=Saccharospirillum impatiens TaxID=169438 RepID=UPI00048C9E8D|nr:2-C-methyl-D-erythritol 4-phosphate cytidylyltransferase [Saccharospirillum impatiens]